MEICRIVQLHEGFCIVRPMHANLSILAGLFSRAGRKQKKTDAVALTPNDGRQPSRRNRPRNALTLAGSTSWGTQEHRSGARLYGGHPTRAVLKLDIALDGDDVRRRKSDRRCFDGCCSHACESDADHHRQARKESVESGHACAPDIHPGVDLDYRTHEVPTEKTGARFWVQRRIALCDPDIVVSRRPPIWFKGIEQPEAALGRILGDTRRARQPQAPESSTAHELVWKRVVGCLNIGIRQQFLIAAEGTSDSKMMSHRLALAETREAIAAISHKVPFCIAGIRPIFAVLNTPRQPCAT